MNKGPSEWNKPQNNSFSLPPLTIVSYLRHCFTLISITNNLHYFMNFSRRYNFVSLKSY